MKNMGARISHLVMRTLFVFAMVMTSVMAMADTQRYVGYTVNDDIDTSGAAFGAAGTYTIGALLPTEMLASYEGCRVLGIRFALSESIGRTRAFLYSYNDGQLAEINAQKQRTYEGWNTVIFNGDGYTISGTESLFFGFDYVETDEMVAGDRGAICGVGSDTDGAFYLYGNYGSGEGLYSISKVGRLCVQLIVDVTNLPLKDIKMDYVDTGFKYKISGSDVEIFTLFSNVGRDTIFSYQLGYQLDDFDPVYSEIKDTLLFGEQEKWEPKCRLTDDVPIGMHTLKVFANQIDGQPLEGGKFASIETTFAVYRDALPRQQVYVEVYEHQQSPYVAMLDKAEELLLDGNDRVALVNTFAYGNPLFVPEADYLHQLYAYDYPTFTFNRSYYPGEPYIAYDVNYYLPQIPASFITGILSDMLYQDYMNPAFASIELSPEYDVNSRELKINVSGETLAEAEAIYGDIALTVLLTEDGVKSTQTVYNEVTQRTNTQKDYVHNQVLRQFVSAPIGDRLTVEEGTYQADYTLTLPEEWNPENMHIIAFITKAAEEVTDDNVRDMDITNANSCAIPFVEPTAITTATTQEGKLQAFAIDGTPIADLRQHHGIAILRTADGQTRKVMLP